MQQLSGILELNLQLLPPLILRHDIIQVRKLNRKIAKPILVADHLGITQQGLNLLMAVSQCLKFSQ
jgi:hypothetical protein